MGLRWRAQIANQNLVHRNSEVELACWPWRRRFDQALLVRRPAWQTIYDRDQRNETLSACHSSATLLGSILAMRIANLSITELAAEALRRARLEVKPSPTSALALVYTSSFRERDGSSMRGFRPGYLPTPWPADYLGSAWLRAHLADTGEFFLMPRFRWKLEESYVLDATWPVFSIEQTSRSDATRIDAVLL